MGSTLLLIENCCDPLYLWFINADYWKEAVRSEIDSILANGTSEIIDRPYGCKPVGWKWVFKKKLRPDGTIEKYKARLVAKIGRAHV